MDHEFQKMLRSLLKEELLDIRTDVVELKTGQGQLVMKLDDFISEMRSGFKQLDRTVKEHRVVIDLIQSLKKPDISNIREY
jgi:hypothetical protein